MTPKDGKIESAFCLLDFVFYTIHSLRISFVHGSTSDEDPLLFFLYKYLNLIDFS